MSRGCPFGIMGSSDGCLGCHSVHPRLVDPTLQASSYAGIPPQIQSLRSEGGTTQFSGGTLIRPPLPRQSCSRVSHAKCHRHIRHPRRTQAQDGASLRASGQNRHPFTMRRTSVTELLARRQIVDIPQPETSLRPHLYHPGDIQNMARNRFTDERRTLPPRSFLNLFTVPVPLRPPRIPSRVVPSSPTPRLAQHWRHRVKHRRFIPLFPEHPLVAISSPCPPHFGHIHQAPQLFPQSQATHSP